MFRVGQIAPSQSEGEIKRLCDFAKIDLPREYLEFIRPYNYITFRYDGALELRFWGGDGCVAMTEDFDLEKWIPGALAIGNDGGDGLFFFAEVEGELGIYKVGMGVMDMSEASFFAPSLKEILEEGRAFF